MSSDLLKGMVPLVDHPSWKSNKDMTNRVLYNVDSGKFATTQGTDAGAPEFPITTANSLQVDTKESLKQLWDIEVVSESKNLWTVKNQLTRVEAYSNPIEDRAAIQEGSHYVWHIYYLTSNNNYVFATNNPKDKYFWGMDYDVSDSNIVLREVDPREEVACQWNIRNSSK